MSPDDQFWWGWWVNAGVAFGTIFLAVIALWGDQLRRLLWPPKLRLGILSAEGEEAQVGDDRRPARFYHLKVSNERRSSPAKRVQVYLLQVEVPRADGEFRGAWAGAVPIRWRHQEVHPLARDLGPDADCDLCGVVKASSAVPSNQLRLYPLVAPHTMATVYEQATRLRLTFQAQAIEADSELLRVEISWDGEWADGAKEMTGHLVLAETPSEPGMR